MITQEEKQVLLKDLSARLPYGVRVQTDSTPRKMIAMDLWDINSLPKPYLRPMSSMTDEEFEEYGNIIEHISIGSLDFNIANPNAFDWLNAYHFDYRNLIEKGLAIEVTESNNPYKE